MRIPTVEERFPTAVNSPRPTEDQIQSSIDIQESVIVAAKEIEEKVPSGRWKSLALTSLEEALMWANKGLFNQKEN